jgi:hypothetical protein
MRFPREYERWRRRGNDQQWPLCKEMDECCAMMRYEEACHGYEVVGEMIR